MARRITRKPRVSPGADPNFAAIKALAGTLHDLHRQKADILAPTVQSLIKTRSRNIREIEHTLDHLLDCACIPEGLALFKSLCRHYFTFNPTATAQYINFYREMWDSEAEPKRKATS
jgi:hypothetical protein